MEGKGTESHHGCLLPHVDKQEMGRCGGQAARRARGVREMSSGGAACDMDKGERQRSGWDLGAAALLGGGARVFFFLSDLGKRAVLGVVRSG
jgi:hypothetical protein